MTCEKILSGLHKPFHKASKSLVTGDLSTTVCALSFIYLHIRERDPWPFGISSVILECHQPEGCCHSPTSNIFLATSSLLWLNKQTNLITHTQKSPPTLDSTGTTIHHISDDKNTLPQITYSVYTSLPQEGMVIPCCVQWTDLSWTSCSVCSHGMMTSHPTTTKPHKTCQPRHSPPTTTRIPSSGSPSLHTFVWKPLRTRPLVMRFCDKPLPCCWVFFSSRQF